jgi:DNA-binding protein H-NS
MPVIDPTKNVLDLVAAQEKSRNALRDSDQKLLAAELHRIAQLSEAETARIDQLRAQDARYGAIMEGMRNDKIDSTAKLLASQLQEIKGDIQVELRSLNQFRWESGGKSSGTNLIAYIIVQVVVSIAGIGTIIGVMYAIFKSH